MALKTCKRAYSGRNIDSMTLNEGCQTIQVAINGETVAVPAGLTVLTLLEHLEVNPQRVAIELNRKIVRQPDWSATAVPPGAQLEIVQFVGGG
jgi:thiamine biosynthesis protein ThiS